MKSFLYVKDTVVFRTPITYNIVSFPFLETKYLFIKDGEKTNHEKLLGKRGTEILYLGKLMFLEIFNFVQKCIFTAS